MLAPITTTSRWGMQTFVADVVRWQSALHPRAHNTRRTSTRAMNSPSPPSESTLTPSSLDFPVVGIGASAGGVQALVSFFEHMAADAGMAFVVVLHLSPKHGSHLAAILQKATAMPVLCPEGPVPIERNKVYVIAPNKALAMNDNYLGVSEAPRMRGRQATIDLFFRTLAVVHRERAFAIVMSGTGADGAVGITRVKEEGGVNFAQLPQEAEFDGMPRAAMATGAVDWVMPVAEMPGKLQALWANAQRIQLPALGPGEPELLGQPLPGADAVKEAEDALRDVLVLLRTRTGHDFRSYKRATVLRRLERRMQVNGLPNLPAYRSFLQAHADESQALLKDLLIGVTNFFRDAEAFDVLERDVVPGLVHAAAEMPEGLRAWVPGCSSGEEAYSLAILLCEQAAKVAHPPAIHLFATDIDEGAIGAARLGIYPTAIEADVSATRLRRYFEKEGHQYRIRKEVREKVMFASHDILRDPPFSKLDLISCRNLLIYLNRDVHAEILEMFHFALKPGGYLFLGSSESADTATHLFSVVDKKNRIFRANVVARTTRYVPTLPMGTTPPRLPPGIAEVPASPKAQVTIADLHHRLAQQYAPPSVLIDQDGNIVHLSEQAGRFLRFGGGVPSHELLSVVDPELRLDLRTAIFQSARTGKSVESRRVHVVREGRGSYVKMIVRPVIEMGSEHPLSMVLFDEVEDTLAPEAETAEAGGRDPMVVQLEDELRRVKEQLQSTIEQAETSTEELKASNEELQAINEELRSATEELETSKEELQSINEELITVNHELKSKVEETGKINDDLQNLIASTDIATVFVDRGMSIKRYTPQACQVFNLIPTDVGRSLLDITHKLDYESLADDAAEAFQSLRQIEREVRSHDGTWYLARVLPYRTTEDRIDGAVLTFVDITSRRKAEDTMRLVAESLREFAIFTVDPEGLITTWNIGAERLFGYTEADVLGQPMTLLCTPEDVQLGVPQQEMQQARLDGRAEDERWHQRKDGTRFFGNGILTPLYEGDALRGFGKITRDITALKRSEAAREERLQRESAGHAEARAHSDLKDEFLAVLSHELKNPLNLIQLSAELLQHAPQARDIPVIQRAAASIRGAVYSQAQIIDDLLDLSRIQTGKLTLHRTGVDAVAALAGIVEAAQSRADGQGVVLQAALPATPLLVDADPVRLEQIVWNLLSNALKFTPAGGRVTLRLERAGDAARLTVADTGRGIDPAALPGVFDMFRQAEPASGGRHAGLGIGLALVRDLVQAHGGRVEAQSAGIGRGATFVVQLPLAQAPAAGAPGASAPASQLQGLRVLIVDNDRPAADTLRSLLEIEGVHVAGADGLRTALQAAREQQPDVVITDLTMPEADGYELLRALQQLPTWRPVPVIALTALGRPAEARRALDAGFAAHLKKPITLARLMEVLDRVLPASGTPAAASPRH
jgi:two-component system CheB/CheR fusion protein